jgi:serine/threonine protein kinase
MTIAAGTKLGRYEIRSKIGAGGMGEVYLASDPKIGRDVAIKVLPAAMLADQERVTRFEREAQAAGALNHPNILAILDVDTQDDNLYVVSELLEGEELRQRLDEGLSRCERLSITHSRSSAACRRPMRKASFIAT